MRNVTPITPEMADWVEQLCGWRPPAPIASAIKPIVGPYVRKFPDRATPPREKWPDHKAVASFNRDIP